MNNETKIRTKNKFVIVMTIKNLIEEGWEIEEDTETYELVFKSPEGRYKRFKTETSLQQFLDDESLNF